jgi:hypothetical protein
MRSIKQTKRFLILILLGLFLFSCQNENFEETQLLPQSETDVSKELAKTVAKNFAYDQEVSKQLKNGLKKSAFRTTDFKSEQKVKEVITIKTSNQLPAFYIINLEPKGYVIVSGNKKETPILAFSDSGYFEYDSLAIKTIGLYDWMENRKKRIKELRNNPSIEVADSVVEQWVYMAPPEDDEVIISGGTVYEQVGPLLSTTWNQGCGYNNLLESCSSGGSCGRVWAGCVATATAQVMRYWEHPSSYSWSAMPNGSGSNETSRLMRDIGDAVDMNYGCNGSGASTEDARDALVYEFGYSSSAEYVHVHSDVVVTQLNYNYPLIMRGEGSGGHAFVCEGYKRTRHIQIHNPGTYYEYETSFISGFYLYMNWGWGGWLDGWFLFNDMTPGSHNYNSDRRMIINVHP